MKKIFVALSLGLLFFALSCKKTDPALPLQVKGADNNTQGNSEYFTSRTTIASSGNSIIDIINENGTNYVVGSFSSLGGINSYGIIILNSNNSFSAYATNLTSGTIRAYGTTSTNQYIGGYFSTTGVSNKYLGKFYSGDSYVYTSAIGYLNGDINTFKKSGSNLYAVGYFSTYNGSSCSPLIYINGSTVYSYGTTLSGYFSVFDCEYFNGYWYIGGSMNGKIKYCSGSSGSWYTSGDGFNGSVFDLENINNELYACGTMTYDYYGTYSMNFVNKLSGGKWWSVGSNNLPTYCNDIEYFNGKIYACGDGYLYYYDASSDTWKNKLSGSLSVSTLRKIKVVNNSLYGIEYNSGTGQYSVVRFS